MSAYEVSEEIPLKNEVLEEKENKYIGGPTIQHVTGSPCMLEYWCGSRFSEKKKTAYAIVGFHVVQKLLSFRNLLTSHR